MRRNIQQRAECLKNNRLGTARLPPPLSPLSQEMELRVYMLSHARSRKTKKMRNTPYAFLHRLSVGTHRNAIWPCLVRRGWKRADGRSRRKRAMHSVWD